MALLIKPGQENLTTVIDRNANLQEILGGPVELYPYNWQLDTIQGSNQKLYRFDVWIGENAALEGKKPNICATLVTHPLNEFYGRIIYGDAVIVPLDDDIKYDVNDWTAICDGVWYDSELVNINVRGKNADRARKLK